MDEKVIEENKEQGNESAAIEEATEGDQKCVNRDGEANEDLSSEGTERKDEIKEDTEAGDKLKEGAESSCTEEAYSNIDSPQKDGEELTSAETKQMPDEDKEGQDKEEQISSYKELVNSNIDTPQKDADSFTTSQERGETSASVASCGKDDEMEADGGAKPEEMPIKGILTVKLNAKKYIQSAIHEPRPETIGVAPKKRNITLNVKEKDSKKKGKADAVPPKQKIDFDPVMTTRFWIDSKNNDDTKEGPETTCISPGKELLGDIEGKIQEDIKFTPKRGDQHRSSFRHRQTVGRIAETNEWHLDADDLRYGVHRTYSEQPPQEQPNGWTILKVVVMDLCCCCCCGSPPDPYYIEEAKNYVQSHQQEEMGENGENRPADQNMEDVSLNCNSNTEEAKPKRVGRMKRIRRFFKRLFCCTAGCQED